MPMAVMIASLAVKGVAMAKEAQAAKQSEALALSVARRNANIDTTAAKQLELDTAENIQRARHEAAIYTSRQETSYAASGVLADSGSPLAVQATTVGRMQQRIQQEHVDATQKEAQMYDSAKAGIEYGDAQAKATSIANTAAMLRGGASMLSTAYGGYESGVFSSAAKPDWSNFDKMDFSGRGEKSGFNY